MADARGSGDLRVRLRPRWLLASAMLTGLLVVAAVVTGAARDDLAHAPAALGVSSPAVCVARPGAVPAIGNINGIAWTLGRTTDQLQWDLSHGQTLPELITARGLTIQQVVESLAAMKRAQLDQRVSAGQLSRAQEELDLATYRSELSQAIAGNTLAEGSCGSGT